MRNLNGDFPSRSTLCLRNDKRTRRSDAAQHEDGHDRGPERNGGRMAYNFQHDFRKLARRTSRSGRIRGCRRC
jgi:hypothetical protein